MKHDLNVAFLILTTALAGCSGADDPDATVEYVSSGCKGKAGLALTATSPSDAASYDGLRCLAWDLSGGKRTFRVYNMEGGCGARYAGRAFVEEAGRTVTLSLTNPGGAIAGCGWCLYDHAFEVEGAARGADLTVTIERSDSGERGKEGTTTFTLPAQARPMGVVCDYGNRWAIQFHAEKTGTVGQRNRPCSSIIDPAVSGCGSGLSCLPVSDAGDDRRCLGSCTVDGGCGGDPFTCAANVCRLKTSGGK